MRRDGQQRGGVLHSTQEGRDGGLEAQEVPPPWSTWRVRGVSTKAAPSWFHTARMAVARGNTIPAMPHQDWHQRGPGAHRLRVRTAPDLGLRVGNVILTRILLWRVGVSFCCSYCSFVLFGGTGFVVHAFPGKGAWNTSHDDKHPRSSLECLSNSGARPIRFWQGVVGAAAAHSRWTAQFWLVMSALVSLVSAPLLASESTIQRGRQQKGLKKFHPSLHLNDKLAGEISIQMAGIFTPSQRRPLETQRRGKHVFIFISLPSSWSRHKKIAFSLPLERGQRWNRTGCSVLNAAIYAGACNARRW